MRAETAAPRAYLSLPLGSRALRVPLGERVVVIGSGDDCELRLSGRGIAPRHVAIRRADNRYLCAAVEPGLTFLHNGRPQTECTLAGGDTLTVGAIALTFTEEARLAQMAAALPARLRAWSTAAAGHTAILTLVFALVTVLTAWVARSGAEAAWRGQLASRHLLEAQLAALSLQGSGVSAVDLTPSRLADWADRQRARGVFARDVRIGVWRADGEPLLPAKMPAALQDAHDVSAWPREPTIGPRTNGGLYARVLVFGRDLRPQAHVAVLWPPESAPIAATRVVVLVAMGLGALAAAGLTKFSRRRLADQLATVTDSVAAFGQDGHTTVAVPDPTLAEWAALADVVAQRCRLAEAGENLGASAARKEHESTQNDAAWWKTVCAVATDPVVVLNDSMRVASYNTEAAALPFGSRLAAGGHFLDLLQACPDLQAIAEAFEAAAAESTHPWGAGAGQVRVWQLPDDRGGRWRVLRFTPVLQEATP